VTPPASLMAPRPATPSSSMPDRITPRTRSGKDRAADSNSGA
jgi:hypothetical protein